jgi:hypothetical protein
LLAACVIATGALAPAAGAETAAPAPTNVRVIPDTEALKVRWGVSSSEGIVGFRIRWRPASGTSLPWSAPVERGAGARGYKITGLEVRPYEVRVRAILEEERLGGVAATVGTPLEAEGPEEGGEEPPLEGATVNAAPIGPPVPLSGWHVAYADGFGAPLGAGPEQDNTWGRGEKWNGCCTNSDEIAVERRADDVVGPEGLQLECEGPGSYTVEGVTRSWSCGGLRTDRSPGTFEYDGARAGEIAVECDCRWPANTGAADPGWWIFPSTSSEIDFFEGWGWTGKSWADARSGVPVIISQGSHCLCSGTSLGLGFNPSRAFHRYTTVFVGGLAVEYVDGVARWSLPATLADIYDGLNLTNALRRPEGGGAASANSFAVRAIAVYQDGAHAGQGIRGGGVAPGTTIAP